MTAFNINNYVLGSPSNTTPAFGGQGVQNDSLTNAFTYGDNVSWQLGRHTLKFGGTAIRYQSNRNYSGNDGVLGHFDYNGTFSGDAWADFLLNQSSAFGQGSYASKWGQRQWRDAIFFQDDWKATPDLTLNLGMRWDYYSPYSEVANRWANFDAKTATVLIAGVNGVDSRVGVSRDFGKVTGFISTGKKPTPLTEEEINEVVNRVSITSEQPKPKFTFDRGDAVKIIDGPFKDFAGVVEDVNPDRNTLKVMLTILGRATPVEIESEQVEKQ